MREPRISIITVSFNSVRTIEQTIYSIVGQSYPNIEYIIIDGGSTDGTVDVIRKYQDKIAYWVSEPDYGIFHAMNKGVVAATGDYIQFIGSDDSLVDERVIERLIPYFAEAPDILSCQEWGVNYQTGYQELLPNQHARDKRTFGGAMIPHAAMFAKRTLLGKYPFDETYRIAGDLKFFLQCYYDPTVRIQFADDAIVYFDMSGASSNQEKAACEDNRIYEELQLPFHNKTTDVPHHLKTKRWIARLRNPFGLGKVFHEWKYRHFRWEKHHCNNPFCRWCAERGDV